MNCPEIGKEISDEAKSYPNCGYSLKQTHARKPLWLIVVSAICGIIAILVLLSAFNDFRKAASIEDINNDIKNEEQVADGDEERIDDDTEDEEQIDDDTEDETAQNAPTTFRPLTEQEFLSVPDTEGYNDPIFPILTQLGVVDVVDAEHGNYENNDICCYLDAKYITDTGKELLIQSVYIRELSDPKWDVLYITDFKTGNYYYVADDVFRDYIDLYDYKTGNLISKHTKDIEDYDYLEEFNKKCDELKAEYDDAMDELKETYEQNTGYTSSKDYTIKHGTLLEANPNGGADGKTLVIKVKITSNSEDNITVKQNYSNIADIIHNQGGNDFNCIDYWAMADMPSGEEKVFAITLSKDVIDKIYSKKIADNKMGKHADFLYIHPSLQ